jgi:hypothetical protein
MIPSGDQRYGAGEDSGVPSIIWRSGLNPGGWRRFSKPRFNTSNRAIDSLDCFCATLSNIVEGNDLKGITNVVVQFGNSLQPPHYRFMSFMSFTHGLQEK